MIPLRAKTRRRVARTLVQGSIQKPVRFTLVERESEAHLAMATGVSSSGDESKFGSSYGFIRTTMGHSYGRKHG